MTAFALVLILGAAAGWIAAKGAPPSARAYLRLAMVLYATLAVSAIVGLSPLAVTAIVATLGSVVLCVAAVTAFRRTPHVLTASGVLALAAIAGIAAAATGYGVLAAVPQVLSAVFMALLARRGFPERPFLYLALSAVCVIGAAACELAPGNAARAGLMLFAAAASVGVAIASDVLVEQRGKVKHRPAIRGAR